jgi:superfamily II DNA or RNA helicase
MLARISSVVEFRREENPDLDFHALRRRLTCQNPKYAEAVRLGFSTYNIPPQITLFEETQGGILLPRGTIARLLQMYPGMQLVDETVSAPVEGIDSYIDLRESQIPAVEALISRNQGCLIGPPAFGKTQVAIETAVRLRERTLFCVHTLDLFAQMTQRIQECTNVDVVGALNADSRILAEFTVGMIQSLQGDLPLEVTRYFGSVFYDECHHMPCQLFSRVARQFASRHRYGMSATLERRDGLHFLTNDLIGPVLYRADREDLVRNGEILQPRVVGVHTNLEVPEPGDYATLIAASTVDEERNRLLLEYVAREARAGHACLALSERIAHLYRLQEMLSREYPDIASGVIEGSLKKAERESLLESFREGRIQVLLGGRVLDEGVDLPNLDRLFLCSSVRSKGKLNQMIGRALRTHEKKCDAVVYDFIDSKSPLARNQWRSRKAEVYRGMHIEEVHRNEKAAPEKTAFSLNPCQPNQ